MSTCTPTSSALLAEKTRHLVDKAAVLLEYMWRRLDAVYVMTQESEFSKDRLLDALKKRDHQLGP